MWHDKAPNGKMCKTFGCRTYVHRDKKLRGGRHNDVVATGIFLGIADHLGYEGSYIVISDDLRRLYISTHVFFNE
eukprot:2500041-Rhodomonas_salina.1